MKLTSEAIKEYQEELFAEFGKKISQKEAEAQSTMVFSFLHNIFNSNENDSLKTTEK